MVNCLFYAARAVFTALVVLFFLMLPEFAAGLIYPSFSLCWDPVKLGVLLMLALSLSVVKDRRFLNYFLFGFGVLQLMQFVAILALGHPVSSFDLPADGWDNVASTFKNGEWYRPLLLFCIVAVPYMALSGVFASRILNRPCFKRGWIVPVLFLAGFGGYTVAEGEREVKTSCCYASYNTLNVSAFYLAENFPQKVKEKWSEGSLLSSSAQAAENNVQDCAASSSADSSNHSSSTLSISASSCAREICKPLTLEAFSPTIYSVGSSNMPSICPF